MLKMEIGRFCNLSLIIWCSVFGLLRAQNHTGEDVRIINITISGFDATAANGQVVSNQIELTPDSLSKIQVQNISPEINFLIVQVHTQEPHIILGYNETFGNSTSVKGSNVGLVINRDDNIVFLRNENKEIVTVLLAVVFYTAEGPIPGGCNMEFSVKESPFQIVSVVGALVEIDAQPAWSTINDEPLKCGNDQITYEAYRLYASEKDFTPEGYFSSISRMLTVEDIRANGKKVPPASSMNEMRRIYSAYPGTGSVYAMIATHGNSSSAYVTTFSYACNPLSDPNSCYLLSEPISKFVCATILFIGIFLTFIGHASFSTEMFLLGSVGGGIVGYTFFTVIGFENVAVEIGLSMLIGVVVGIISIIVGYIIGMPCIAILQASLTLGCLIASTAYYGFSDGMSMLESDANFWLIYLMIMVVVPLVFCISPPFSNIICCAVFGGYLIILPIDFWLGSNLKYIIINTIRRVTVPDFNIAVISPPFQTIDILLAILWIVLALLGIRKQKKILNGRMGFPNYTTTVSSEERYPVLSERRNGRRVLVLRDNDRVQRHSGCCFN